VHIFFGKSAYEQLIKSLDRDKIVEMSRRNVALHGQFGIMPRHLFHLVGRSLNVSRTAMLGRPYRELQGAIRFVASSVNLPYLCDIFYFRCRLSWKTNVFCFFF
jgi:hypothetical protein